MQLTECTSGDFYKELKANGILGYNYRDWFVKYKEPGDADYHLFGCKGGTWLGAEY